jgi:hypothetical protein
MIEAISEEERAETVEDDDDDDAMRPERVAPFVGFMMSDHAEDVTGCIFRAGGEFMGVVSDPEISRMAFREGGWDADQITERFYETIGQDIKLNPIAQESQ